MIKDQSHFYCDERKCDINDVECPKKRDRTFTVTTQVKISEETLRDIVITAVEGGIGYWCQVEEWRPVSHPETILSTKFREDNGEVSEAGAWMTLDLQKFAEAIVQLANDKGYAIDKDLAGSLDSLDADIVIQTALLGEVVYG